MSTSSLTERGYLPPQSRDETYLQRRVAGAVKAARNGSPPQHLGFFNDRQQQLAQAMLRRQKWQEYIFDGGYEGAERAMLCVFTDNVQPCFPFAFLRISAGSGRESLSHRDYLGALLAAGITRDSVGDIVVDAAGASVVLRQQMASCVLQEVREVGRSPVVVAQLSEWPCHVLSDEGEALRANVPSLRLDAILAALLHTSRAQAQKLVESGKVQVNHVQTLSTHAPVAQGDIFSIKGTGRLRIDKIAGKTKKDRVWIEYTKY